MRGTPASRLVPLVLLGATLACDPGPPPPVVLGVPGAWTRPRFDSYRMGARLAAEEVNAAGGVRGAALELRFVDDGVNEPLRAVEAAEELADDPAVVAVVGHLNSLAVRSAVPVYVGRLPAVVPVATNPGWSDAEPWAFQLNVPDSAYAERAERYVAERGWRRPAVLFDNTPGGRTLAAQVRHRLPPGTLFQPVYLESDVGSYRPVVEALRQRKVDGVVLLLGGATGIAVVPHFRELAPDTDLLGFLPMLPLVLDGTVGGMDVLLPEFVNADGLSVDPGFRSRFRERFDAAPDAQAALAYDAVRILASGMADVGASRSEVARWLRSSRVREVGGTATGPVSFDERGVREGARVVVRTVCPPAALPNRACR